jgi:signal transduction histidine kinase
MPVPLLVVRLRDLEKTAWREGRSAARALEKRSVRSFVEVASRTLRASDIIVHDAESSDFIAALVSPNREDSAVATATDCRATLARLSLAMETGSGLRLESGWSILHGIGRDEELTVSIESALERGLQERERYDFFAALGHELRTPLTSLLGYLETLIEEDLDGKTRRHFLRVAQAEGVRLARLVDGMFEVSLMDLRSGSERAGSCSIRATTMVALVTLAPLAESRGTKLQLIPHAGEELEIERPIAVHCASASEIEVAVSADRLTQIVLNLTENAIKHGRAGGTVRVSVLRIGGRYVELCVDDDGPGIPLAERDAIFRFGSRGSGTRAKGSGIGLAIVRLMVERVGGEIDAVASDLGGASFRVRLPLHSGGTPIDLADSPLGSHR